MLNDAIPDYSLARRASEGSSLGFNGNKIPRLRVGLTFHGAFYDNDLTPCQKVIETYGVSVQTPACESNRVEEVAQFFRQNIESALQGPR